MIRILLAALLLYPSGLFAQDTLIHTVYFGVDKDHVTVAEAKRIDLFLHSFDLVLLHQIELGGHTDSDADSLYNLDLSRRRVEAVSQYIVSAGMPASRISKKHYGEDKPAVSNKTSDGKMKNRRVDIRVVHYSSEETETVPIRETENKIEGDTMLTFPQGTKVVVSKEYFLKNPDCISMIEYNTGESLRNSDLSTMTSDNEPLISGGMFDITLCEDAPCVKVLLPVRTVCGRIFPYTVWGVAEDGAWQENNTADLEIVTIGGSQYYQTEVCQSGRINLDVKAPKPKKIKIKGKGKIKLTYAKLSFDEPVSVYYPYHISSRKVLIAFGGFCPCSEALIHVRAVDTNSGDTLTIDYRRHDQFDKREAFGRCKKSTVIKKILLFGVREKRIYKKYLVRRKDF